MLTIEKMIEGNRTTFALEGKPTKQIAGETGMTDVQVRVRLHRIRRKLKKGMNDDA